jgi:uncharacterized membrane protein YeaQ/YmgE (transglycosylase-associated protein family)
MNWRVEMLGKSPRSFCEASLPPNQPIRRSIAPCAAQFGEQWTESSCGADQQDDGPVADLQYHCLQCKLRKQIMGVLWTIVLGFVIGVVAKLLHPGKENMGFLMTVMLGIAGSFLAGVIGQFLGWYQAGEGAGFIVSVIVAIILLVVYGKLKQNASPPQ